MMRRFKYLSILIAILTCAQLASAQVDCAITLKEAQKQYDVGVIEKVPAMLTACLKSGFSKEEKLQALKLLTLTYLFEDKVKAAQETMMKILKIDPEYAVNEAVDPIEFINLHGSFRTEAIYTFGLSGGLNFSNVNSFEDFGVGNLDSAGVYLGDGTGFQVAVSFSRHIMEGLSANVEFCYMNRKFQFTDNRTLDFASIEMKESQNWFSIPLSVSYSFLKKKKLQPYIRAGYVPSFLMGSKISLTRTYTDNSLPSVTGPEIPIDDLRNSSSSWLSGGIGAKYKIDKGHFTLDVRYLYGNKNQTKTSSRYSNSELIYKYYYTDSDFFVDNIVISVGYSYSLYNPKLKNKH